MRRAGTGLVSNGVHNQDTHAHAYVLGPAALHDTMHRRHLQTTFETRGNLTGHLGRGLGRQNNETNPNAGTTNRPYSEQRH